MPWRVPLRQAKAHSAFTALLLAVLLSSSLTVYLNERRAAETDRERISSCVRGYEGTRSVFRVFFRRKSLRTPKQQQDIEKFNTRIDQLKAGCPRQVKEEK